MYECNFLLLNPNKYKMQYSKCLRRKFLSFFHPCDTGILIPLKSLNVWTLVKGLKRRLISSNPSTFDLASVLESEYLLVYIEGLFMVDECQTFRMICRGGTAWQSCSVSCRPGLCTLSKDDSQWNTFFSYQSRSLSLFTFVFIIAFSWFGIRMVVIIALPWFTVVVVIITLSWFALSTLLQW